MSDEARLAWDRAARALRVFGLPCPCFSGPAAVLCLLPARGMRQKVRKLYRTIQNGGGKRG